MTDPTITIAGLRAQVESLIESIGRANSQCASFCDIIDESRSVVARVEAERDAMAAQLTEVRAELVQLGGADLARDAAEDRAARLDADLAKVRAELAAAPKVCAIHSYEHGPGPCMTCGAWPPGTRELIAACQARIAGLEQAADERSRTGQVFAGVSIDELCSVYSAAYGERPGHRDDRRPDAIRAVLARLEVSLVAPVDPEAVARAYHDHKDAPAPEWDEVDIWRGRDADEQTHAIAAMRATLTARGIPVTPEVDK